MNLQKGTYLQGNKYQIIDILGQGGFGTTYLAFQHGLNRKVAIKEFFMKDFCQRGEETTIVTMGTDSSRDMVAQFKKKFIKEAQTIAGLNDNHIIRIHDIFEENATAYYVMEYIEEGDLLKRIPEGGMREYDAIKTIQQVADALYYIHNHNILHLDIKPSNILFRKKDELVIIDFGISKHYDEEKGSQTSSTPIGISEGYAPLEQYEIGGVKDFSPATDIYSLGATLYHLLSGKCPPSASRIINKGLPALPDRITQQTKNAITKAMSFRQDNRPQTVAEFMQLLPGLYGNAPRENVQQELDKEKVTANNLNEDSTFDNIRRWAIGICIIMLIGLSIIIFS